MSISRCLYNKNFKFKVEKMNEFGLKQMREMNGDLEDMR